MQPAQLKILVLLYDFAKRFWPLRDGQHQDLVDHRRRDRIGGPRQRDRRLPVLASDLLRQELRQDRRGAQIRIPIRFPELRVVHPRYGDLGKGPISSHGKHGRSIAAARATCPVSSEPVATKPVSSEPVASEPVASEAPPPGPPVVGCECSTVSVSQTCLP